jgi:hypothetical protein
MLKCVTETEGVQILREVHSGTCDSHAGPRALAAKVIRQGFYWPAMICAANRVTRSCEACQKFSPRSGSPSQFTKLIAHTWPLQHWGLDIVGPLPTAQGNLKFTFVAVEYFTKWIEARAVSTITSKTVQKFFWQNIVCRFGVPSELTVDNCKQFDNQDFKDFCFSIGTKLAFASVYHPQSNGVVERANGKIFTAVKKMLLDDKKGKWANLLPEAVWALNTIECRATGFTPFRLLYGSEAMTPQEIKHGSPRTVPSAVPDVDEPTSNDLIDGDRVFALQALNKYQAQTKAWRDHTVIPREFSEGDLVLVRTAQTESRGKLEPKWEGPFIVKMKASPSAYRLTTPSGEELEHSWNIDNLHNFLFDSLGPARPCNSQINFIPARTLFLPGVRFLTRRSHVIYTRKIPRKNLRRKKTASTVFSIRPIQSTASGSAGYPRVRHSAQKPPKGAAGLAQQVRKIEVFFKRLSVQKSPKGAAGLAQQVRKIEVFFKRLSVQKSPKGAAGLAQRVRKIEGTLHPCKSLHRETVRAKTDYRRSQTDIINVPDQVRNAPMDIAGCAKAHNLIIQTIVTHVQRGHHTLHWFNLRNDSHLPPYS